MYFITVVIFSYHVICIIVFADTLDKLSDVLTVEQLTEYEEIQEERKAKLRARIR
jgi:hypothetical protein